MSLKKKISTAILVGFSAIAVSSISFASPADNALPVPPPDHQMMVDFDRATLPPRPEAPDKQQYKAAYQQYVKDIKADKNWNDFATKRAAMAYVAIDRAADNNTLTSKEAKNLKKAVNKFYKDNISYSDEVSRLDKDQARAYMEEHKANLFINENLASIAKQAKISEDTATKVLRPQPKDHRPDFKGSYQRAVAFANQMVKSGKVTSDEANTLLAYMQSSHEKFAKMSEDESKAYFEQERNLTPAQRLDQMAKETGISSQRLGEIFAAVKDEIQTDININKQVQEQQAPEQTDAK